MRAAVGLSLAVLDWPAFPHWWDFRLYLLMKKVCGVKRARVDLDHDHQYIAKCNDTSAKTARIGRVLAMHQQEIPLTSQATRLQLAMLKT